MPEIFPGNRVHLQLRQDSFVIYTDGGTNSIELYYADADEVIQHLTRVMGTDAYVFAKPLPPNRSPGGHVIDAESRKLRQAGGAKRPVRKMKPICDHCGEKCTDSVITQLAQREFQQFLCRTCYMNARNKMFPSF
jgi:hypothetical protein